MLIENTPSGFNFDWNSNFLTYNSNFSYLYIIVGSCDNTKSEDPKVLNLTYDYYPFNNWK